MSNRGAVIDDFRNALRQWRRAPGVTAIALLSLVVGIGANLGLFSLVDALLWKRLPIAEPATLVRIVARDILPGRVDDYLVSTAVWNHIRDAQPLLASVLAAGSDRVNLATGGEARYASCAYVSDNYFDLLGVPIAIGRGLTADDERAGAAPVAVISHALWQSQYAGAAHVLHEPLSLDGQRFDIVGVAAPGFFGLTVGRRDDVFITLAAHRRLRAGAAGGPPPSQSLQVFGRLTAEAAFDSASAAMRAWYPALRAATIDGAPNPERHLPFPLDLSPADRGQSILRQSYAQPLLVLLTAAGVVLLIACTNLAVLVLARFSDRRHELGVRLSLGASRMALVRLLITESVLLSIVGAAGGVWFGQLVAGAAVPYLTRIQFGAVPTYLDLAIDGRLALVAATLAIVCGLVAGALPALRASRVPAAEALRMQGRDGLRSRRTLVLMRGLAEGQVALSTVLLVGALLLVRSFVEITTRPAGVERDDVLVAAVSGDLNAPSAVERVQRIERLRDALRAVPGVEAVSAATVTPLSGLMAAADVRVPGSITEKPMSGMSPFNRVLPGYFSAVGTPLLMGRDFDERDGPVTPPGGLQAAIVNRAFAELHFGGFNPLGRVLTVGQRHLEIVGVVANSRFMSLREDRDVAMAFGALPQSAMMTSLTSLRFIMRADNPDAVRAGALTALRAVDSRLVVELRTMSDEALSTVNRERLLAWTGGVFASLGVVMAVIGLYGTFSYAVVRRRAEIGVRLALGATRRGVTAMFLREAALVILPGAAVGVAAALGAGRWIQSLLFGVTTSDPATLAIAVGTIVLAATVATFIPARRVASLAPSVALRHD